MENEIDKIIDYLRLNRITEEFEKTHQNTDIGLDILTGNSEEEFFIETQQRFEDFSIYNRLVNLFDALQVTHLYLSVQGNNITYFIRRTITNNQGNQTFEYRDILNTNWSAQNDSGFIKKPVNLPSNNYFYNTELERVVIKNTILQSVLVTNDTLMYNPQEVEYISNGKYNFDYEDHGGNRDTLFATVMKAILGSGNESREILFKKEELKNNISLIPTIKEDRGSLFTEYPFTVKYPYLSKNNGMFSAEKSCLSFSFKSISTFLEFLNQTIILEPNFDFDETNTERRKKFKDDYVQIVAGFFKKKLENTLGEMSYREALMLLHYLPEKVVIALPKEQLWLLLKKTIAFNTINNRVNLDEENLVIKLLKCISQIETNKTLLLKKLLSEKSKEESYFKILYDAIDGDNFIKFTQIIQDIWKKSAFILPTKEQYPDIENYGPMFLPYESEKFLGLYFSNADVSFNEKNQNIHVSFETDRYKERTNYNTKGAPAKVREKIIEEYDYHPFYPIFIENAEEQETEIKFDMIIPAFLLKANEDKEFWHNAIKTGEYTLDVVTTLSGVGNLAKFRYLKHLGEAGSIIAKVKLTAGIIEVTSGVTNLLLKLSGLEESKLGKAIQKYLFWLELLSLGGEAAVNIKNLLKKSAQEVLEHEDELIETLIERGVKDTDEVLDELYELAEEKVRSLNIGNELDNIADEIVDVASISKIAAKVKKAVKLDNFDIVVIDRNNKDFADLFKKWQAKPGIEGVFIPRNGVYGRYGLNLKGPKIYLFAGQTSDGLIAIRKHTLQHEIFHVEMHAKLIELLGLEKYKKLIDKIPTHIKEEYVVHRFLQTNSKAKNVDALDEEILLINKKYRKDAGLNNHLTTDYLKKDWNLKNELKKLNIHY
jgi:hypothetical protein